MHRRRRLLAFNAGGVDAEQHAPQLPNASTVRTARSQIAVTDGQSLVMKCGRFESGRRLGQAWNEPFLAAGGPANLSSLSGRGAIDEVPASSSENTFNGINVGRDSTGNLITGQPGQRQQH